MSDDEGFDFTQEPRKVFVNFLIFNIKEIEAQIFFSRTVSPAIKSLRGLIGSLDAKSKKALKQQFEKLMEYDRDGTGTREDIEKIYSEVCTYLHNSYLKESYYARPKYPTSKLEVPKS